MHQAYLVFGILIVMMGFFIWGRWRYDLVAFSALMLAVLIGVVPFSQAFSGFSNPAVITVACVMIISGAIINSGLVDIAVKKIMPQTKHISLHIATLTLFGGFLSAFMNNIGALALLMPVAIQSAHDNKRSPALLLMPLAFASVLGGLSTAIGTPPNILISAYRQELTGHAYSMFDFSPVGIVTAIAGIAFIALIGWRLLPKREAEKNYQDLLQIKDYITEVSVPENSPIVGKTRRELENMVNDEFSILGMIRHKKKRFVIPAKVILQENDILILEASHKVLKKLLLATKLQLVEERPISKEYLGGEDVALIEAVVPAGSRLDGRSSSNVRLRSRFGINLLAIARESKPFKERLHSVSLKGGDVILLQGNADTLHERAVNFGLLPIVERGVAVTSKKADFTPLYIFIAAIICAAFQWLPVQIAFSLGVMGMILSKSLAIRHLYESVDWSIIVLLGAIIPVGQALQTTGGTELIAQGITHLGGSHAPVVILTLVMLFTMTLSDVMNNAATAVIMAPIAVSLAQALQVHIDPFLMAVAIGASCSFLTPVSHQSNMLVMGPGGYKFYDYIRLGLPLEILVLLVSIPMILWIWPL